MPVRFAINGLGRIGRALLRIAAQRPGLELVAINDVASPESLAGLVARDSLHGAYSGTVALSQGNLLLDGRSIRCSRESEPARVPWEGSGAQAVVDATGKCLTRECAGDHQRGEVERVIVSANAAGMDLTVCMGVNHADYDAASHHLLSGASCTTNCLVPIAHLLQREYGIRHGMLNTVHSYNNDQSLLESAHHDPRRARAAALNMIPTTTSAIQATIRVLPELDGRIEGFAIRVPTPNVSLIDFVVELEAAPTLEEIAELFPTVYSLLHLGQSVPVGRDHERLLGAELPQNPVQDRSALFGRDREAGSLDQRLQVAGAHLPGGRKIYLWEGRELVLG